MSEAAALTDLQPVAQGKVRDIYAVGEDRLLLVTSDRISTYDAVHPTPIPDKGKVLTGLSVQWFGLTRDIVPNHFISATDGVPTRYGPDTSNRGAAVRRQACVMPNATMAPLMSPPGSDPKMAITGSARTRPMRVA